MDDQPKQVSLGRVLSDILAVKILPDVPPSYTWILLHHCQDLEMEFAILCDPFNKQPHDIIRCHLCGSCVGE